MTRTPGGLPFPMLRRAAFWGYAAVLFVATHWPKLQIKSDYVERPDLVLHLGAFGIWGFLLCWSGYLGPPQRGRTAARALGLGLVFAVIDESSQAIPILGRTPGIDDYLANAGGLAFGCVAALASARLLVRRLEPRSSPGAAL